MTLYPWVVVVLLVGGLPLAGRVLVPVGLGAVTTGAGAAVVTGGGAEWVVVTGGGAEWVVGATGAEVVATGAAAAVAVVCTVVAWWVTLGLGFGFGLVVVVDVDWVVAGVDAADVELVLEADVPPQPATATPATMMLRSVRFMDPASNLDWTTRF